MKVHFASHHQDANAHISDASGVKVVAVGFHTFLTGPNGFVAPSGVLWA